jgi:membrane protease YdiL (CAAX protease family)
MPNPASDPSLNHPLDPPRKDENRPSGPRQGRLGLGISWLVILGATLLWMAKPAILSEGEEIPNSEVSADSIPDGLLLAGGQDELMGRVAYSLYSVTGDASTISQAEGIRASGPAGEVAYAILVASMLGAEAGMKALDECDSDGDPRFELLRPAAASAFRSLADEARIPESDADVLRTRLGWFGDLACDLGDPEAMKRQAADAMQLVIWLGVFGVIFGLAGLTGVVLGIVLLVMSLLGKVRSRVEPTTHHGVYAETFAIWMLAFFGFQLLLEPLTSLAADVGVGTVEELVLPASIVAFFASLVTLAWPTVRGVRFATMRKDVGLHFGRGVVEVFHGILAWMVAVPMLFIGAILMVFLTWLVESQTGETPAPSHPVQQAIADANFWGIVQIYVLASVAAPVVEETMFRGVFYSHLRGLMRTWATPIAMVLAALVSSVIFAAIHPQGLVAIPPLAGLAVGFCVAREVRGSLVAPMVAHGLSNALVMTLNVLLIG